MARKQTIIVYPHLNDCDGDITKQWYVEYKWRVPGDTKLHKERVYKGLSCDDAEARYKKAKEIIKEKTTWLKSGEYLTGQKQRIYEDELMYRNEAKLYGSVKQEVVTTRTNLSEFLQQKKLNVNDKTYQNYKSKLRAFNAFLENNKLHELHIKNINRQNIIDFTHHLVLEEDLSRLTIEKYVQIIKDFFDFELNRGNIGTNPVSNIPKIGKIVDCAAMPFSGNDRLKLKNAIKGKDPQLWLACQIQYYCAIRPGTELRLMKISWIDFDRKQLRIPNIEAKNDTTELVEIPDFLFEEMKEYQLQQYDAQFYVFGKFGVPGNEHLGKNTLRNRFNRYREALGISSDHKFYSWKHTGAIELINNGAQPFDLMEHLRHKNFDTTERYLRKRIKNPKKRISKFSSEI